MKTSLSLLLLLFLFFLSSATSSRNFHHHHCNSFSKRTPRSLCFNLQRTFHKNNMHIPVPQQGNGVEVDPRYGVDKRLVPSGPNPLHN
uniref:CLAVATA3/ESR (CLE)-related protein 9-like n=1 Tax=Cicer arietinum TaxID=3827 RepID=A0A3Q7YC19_CICAR|nr:CLAVATA3/ESR (CLE)-related protein 9-like [Cicer arietinum]